MKAPDHRRFEAMLASGRPLTISFYGIAPKPRQPPHGQGDHCYVKTWSENEGILEQLVAQGLLQNKGVRHQATGAPICKILF